MLITENALRKIIAQEYKKLMEGDVVDFAAARAKRMGAEKSQGEEVYEPDPQLVRDLGGVADALKRTTKPTEDPKKYTADFEYGIISYGGRGLKTLISNKKEEVEKTLASFGLKKGVPEGFTQYVLGKVIKRPPRIDKGQDIQVPSLKKSPDERRTDPVPRG